MDGAEVCDASLVDALRVMALFQESSLVEEDGEAIFVTGKSRFPSPYSNVAFPIADDLDPDEFLERARRHFSDRRWFVWARGAFAAALEDAAAERGFISFGTIPGMVIDAKVAPANASELVVARVEDEAAFHDFVRVAERAYAEAGLPREIAASLLARPAPAIENSDIFVARLGGDVVAAALSITNARTGISGVYWVGTVPEARRNGAACAVTRAVTNAAFDRGASVVTLQASDAGEPVYRRMGYREMCRYLRMLSPAKGK